MWWWGCCIVGGVGFVGLGGFFLGGVRAHRFNGSQLVAINEGGGAHFMSIHSFSDVGQCDVSLQGPWMWPGYFGTVSRFMEERENRKSNVIDGTRIGGRWAE